MADAEIEQVPAVGGMDAFEGGAVDAFESNVDAFENNDGGFEEGGEDQGAYFEEGYAEEDPVADIEPGNETKLFGKWSFTEVECQDISLQDYIACTTPHATYLPHTAGRYQKKRFRKASCPIVERLACCLMRKGRNSGKKLLACRIVQHTLEIINLLTDQNPIQIVVEAIINSGPREDSTRVGGAGVVRRQAVDMSPFRRVNYALYLIATGARESSFRNLKSMSECLAEELINAAKGSSNSYAIKKKDEIERVSKSNR
mmetsp:Transcript_49648/g.97098  ORF Transcript_49648/g.97098 Transcript_49648/m.97098 type:complete len:258 (-) Transcript_49648:70-843(-)